MLNNKTSEWLLSFRRFYCWFPLRTGEQYLDYSHNIAMQPETPSLMAMAVSVPVGYIVNGDKKLTDLDTHAGSQIFKYSELLLK